MKKEKPLNGFCYTDAELDSDPELKARVKAERRAAWDRGAMRPLAQHGGNSRTNRPQPAMHSSD